MLEVQTIGF